VGSQNALLSDAELLEHFITDQDEAAFATLVRRHGAMVLGVCRAVLRHHQDAQDVFQATFLVLARKAAFVRRPESLGSWLQNLDEKMKSLLWDRVDAAKREVKARCKEFHSGRGLLQIYLDASRRLLEAERDMSAKKADQATAWEMQRQRMQDAYDVNLARYDAARIAIQDLLQAKYYRLDAEIGLERAKAQGK
jgi:DNA-directed RNA polymerase specialized sigma24 family protein